MEWNKNFNRLHQKIRYFWTQFLRHTCVGFRFELRRRFGYVASQGAKGVDHSGSGGTLPWEQRTVHLAQFQVGRERRNAEQGSHADRTAPGDHHLRNRGRWKHGLTPFSDDCNRLSKTHPEEKHGVPRPAPSSVAVVYPSPERPSRRRRSYDFFLNKEDGLEM